MVNNISVSELIRRIAVKYGVPEPEAKMFFEIFLVLISNKLAPGDHLFMKGTGYFHLKRALMRGPGTPGKEITIVLFSTELNESPTLKDHLLLNVPHVSEDDYFKSPDHHFSLSIGKPVIPLSSSRHAEFILPPSGPELRQLLYSKAERLLGESEIVKRGETQTAPIIIPLGGKPRSFQVDPVSESIIDFEDDVKVESVPTNSIEENYPAAEIIKQTEEKPPIKPPVEKQPEESKPLPPKYERVKSVRVEVPKSDSRVEGKGDFTEDLTSNKNLIQRESERRKERSSPKTRSNEDNSIISQRIKQDEEDHNREMSYRSRRSRAGIILLAALLVLSVAAALIYYSPLFRSEETKPPVIADIYRVQPIIIERSYEIPVTYPYDGTVNLSGFTFDPIALVQNEEIRDQAQNPPPEVKQERISEISAVTPVKLKDNIFGYNDIIVVQVSSWKSLSKAKAEVAKYNAAGYNAFLDDANLQGKGTYYRVRVGNFKTLGEAEQFLRKNY